MSSHGEVSYLLAQAIEEAQAEAAKNAAEVQLLRHELAQARGDIPISIDTDQQ